MLGKLIGSTTKSERPQAVEAARRMMQSMSPEDIAGVQRGMAERPDSIATLSTIDVPTLVSYLSEFMTLLPGDMISTGTPAGVGLGFNPPRFVKPGDVMELGIEGLGESRQVAQAWKPQAAAAHARNEAVQV